MKVAIGGFDGMHKAHLEIIKRADAYIVIEKNTNLTPTFDRIEYSSKLLDLLFLNEIKHLKASQFINYLKTKHITKIIVGEDFRFGYQREGNLTLLKKYFDVEVIKEIKYKNTPIHSRIIREYIKKDIEYANKLLGHNYKIKAIQIKGQGIGKKELVATINLKPIKNYLLPSNGVYLTRINNLPSLTFIGNRSTDNNFSIETHILKEFSHNSLYHIEFIKKIRDNKKFSSLNELKKEIQNDISTALKYFDNSLKTLKI